MATRASALIYFNQGLNLALFQDWPLFKHWLHILTNTFIIIYPTALFQDKPLFKYRPSFKPLHYVQ